MMLSASIRLSAALFLLPFVASAQPAFQPPPPAFQTPSGNIHCRFGAGTLRCDVAEHSYAVPPRPRDCPQDWGGSITLRAQGEAALLCAGDTVRDDEAFVLGYGADWLGPGINCDSEESGIRCANRAGHGFQVSRTKLELF
jgi:hypothetical protein